MRRISAIPLPATVQSPHPINQRPLVDSMRLPRDMRKNFFQFVTHTLQGQYLKLCGYGNLSEYDTLRFKKLIRMMGKEDCGTPQIEVISQLAKLFLQIEENYFFHRQFELLVDAEEERAFSRILNACRGQIMKLSSILEGKPYIIFPETFSLERMIGNITVLVGTPSSSYRYNTPTPLFLHSDRTDTFLLLENLLSNSKRACERQTNAPHIEIIGFPSDMYPGMAEILVRDNGIGFTPGELRAAEEQRKFTTKTGVGDELHGIGLTHCRFIVNQHGGIISISSVKGHGTEITFTLPASSEQN